MRHSDSPSTLTAQQVLDTYFLEVRSRLLDIAATLDRLDRAADLHAVRGDRRLLFIAEALKVLESNSPQRTQVIQELYSKE